jgi:formylglycine-generating enzyme required for sulfatase activity
MGSPTNEPGRDNIEGPQRRVTIRQFAAGRRFDVTRGQWAAFVSATSRVTTGGCAWAGPSHEKLDPKVSWNQLGLHPEDHHPVVCLTWPEAEGYVHWLSQRTGHKYRLLGEAEWEYAARGGTSTAYPFILGDRLQAIATPTTAPTIAARNGRRGRDQWLKTRRRAHFGPNQFGLYDRNGNVRQRVQDCFAGSYAGCQLRVGLGAGPGFRVARTLD